MSGWTKSHATIKNELVGKTGVRVLVVEGVDDQAFFESLLRKKRPDWENDWIIGVAEGKDKLLKILDKEPTWLGVIDRDEWSDNRVAKAQNDHPNQLFVLPRYCMESYFIIPDEIEEMLSDARRNRLPSDPRSLITATGSEVEKWVRHGALWHTINPLWEGLVALGFKSDLLDLENAQDDAFIESKLQEWHDHLDPTALIQEFQNQLSQAQSDPSELQFTKWMHGKHRFLRVVVPGLNRLFGQQDGDAWLNELRRNLDPPSDLDPLWAMMNL